MKKSQLELALSAAGQIARDSEFIVFGSQSILGTVPKPPKACLVSLEVDLYPRNHPQAWDLVVNELGRRSMFSQKQGFFVDCVAPNLAAFPEGWTERLVPFRTRRTRGVTGWCVELHDVSASKLAVTREKDVVFVRSLLAARLIKPVVLLNRVASLPVKPSHRKEILALVGQLVREVRANRKSKRKEK
jgi:hypothetical protein